MPDYSNDQKRRVIKRELGFRRIVYAASIARGSMTSSEADWEISVMEAILADYPEDQANLFKPEGKK